SPSSSAAERAVDAARELGFPAVVKPCSLSGSRGVIRADDPDEARAAAVRARRILADAGGGPDEPLLVEEFVPGAELAVEGIVRSGVFEALALFDKPDPLDGPFFEETIYVTPARLDEGTVAAVTRLVGDAVAAIGLREGPVHAEVRVATGDRGPVLLEAASRTIGGNCARALRFATGASLEEIVLAHYLGIPSPAPPDSEASGVVMIPIPRTGRLVAVRGLDRARAVEHVTGAEISIPPGRLVRALPEGDRYLGFAFARAETPDLVEAALRAALAELEIEIEIEAA
ncbi:MAG: ATP-grasp domain-containing protein, partial [Actinomycetota bacterium]|nr:ATP-grasp domain-containing protein [Actinomycetota bacterium]